MNRKKLLRYLVAGLLAVLMVAVAEMFGNREIIFPEIMALAIGGLIIDKQVWVVSRLLLVILLSIGSVVGVCIVRYSPFIFPVNLALSFAFAALCLLLTRTTIIPLISACMLPVLLHTESWIYPLSVLVLTAVLAGTQKLLEMIRLRKPIEQSRRSPSSKNDWLRWLALLVCVFLVATISYCVGCRYLVIPPLVVAFSEIVNSHAGFRNRPTQIFILMFMATIIGTTFQLVGYYYLGLPLTVVAICIAAVLFLMFELTGKFFAPAGALAYIPMVVQRDGLEWLPLQAGLGAAVFITIAMVVFLRCYRWSRAQLLYCIVPTRLRGYLVRNRVG